MKIYLLFILLLISFFASGQNKDFPAFEKHIFKNEKGTMPYRLLKPKHYDRSKKYPLVLFLHGAGERGTNNEVPLTHIAPMFLKTNNRKNFPCFVLVPQCPKGKRWVEVDWSSKSHTIPKEPSLSMSLVMDLLEKTEKNHAVNPAKIYITGLSMGGYGTWDLIARMPNKFACAVPICGGADEKTAKRIKDLPIWVFHGALDGVVPPERSRNMVKALQKLESPVEYTEYPKVYHGSWKPAYANPNLIEWIFEQEK